jgi:3-deoxy-D-manno-octulosonic acid kinase
VAGGDPDKGEVDIMRLERVPSETGAILYDPRRLAHPHVDDFDPKSFEKSGRVTRAAKGRGSAWFLEPTTSAGVALALRHYRRGGLIARWIHDRYWWSGEESTRCFRELRLLALLEDLGLPAARPVGALYERVGLVSYRAALLTVRISGGRPLSSQFGAVNLEVWQRVGATIAAFHAAGVCHADLNAHNILIDARGGVHLIDFDRGQVRKPGPWMRSNLARLARSLAKLNGPKVQSPAWQALMSGYEAPRGAPLR